MSSLGSSISSQDSEDAMINQPTRGRGGPPLGRIKSEHGTSSSRDPTYDNSSQSRMMRLGGSDGRVRPTALNSSSRTISAHDQLPSHAHSSRGDRDPPTWSEFLMESSTLTAGIGRASDTDPTSTLAADRKRRLTASAHDSGRRRTVSGGFHNRQLSGQSHQLDGPSSPQRSAWPRRTDSIDRSQSNYIDLTTSSPPASQELAPSNSARPPFRSVRQYVLPRWQPDSEASECPICKRPFSLLFRRHHCRKCGRVVCNDCSPHRITIPRQFIVHPPNPNGQIQSRPQSTRASAETIDLTGDSERVEGPYLTRTTTAGSNPALGGGEKVRLCNPCVPDPQPNPQLDPNLSLPAFPRQSRWPTVAANEVPPESSSGRAIPRSADIYQAALSEQRSELRRQRGRGTMVSLYVMPALLC